MHRGADGACPAYFAPAPVPSAGRRSKIQTYVEWGDQRPLSNLPSWEDAMKLPRRQFLPLAAAAAALPAFSRMARAQAYPSKPLRWIIGFPAGGGADTVARIMEPWLSKRLGQPIIIENRPGASPQLAVQTVVNSPPDGYTLLWHGLSSVVNASLFVSLPFDIHRDIAPVAGVVSYPMIMVAHPSVPAQTVTQLIAH